MREEAGASAQASPIVRFDQARRGGEAAGRRSLSFALPPGSFHILTGPGGAGKTSVLRLICLADTPTQGVVQVFGRDVATLSGKDASLTRRRIGAVLHPLVFVDHFTVWNNAALAPRVTGRRLADYANEVDAVLKWMGLAKLADALPHDLSAGERHRLAIARAVVNRPEILLVDAPDIDLDGAEANRVLKLVTEIHAAGVTVLMASRDAAFAAAAGHPMIQLHEGGATLSEPDGR
jgi:cell division transport system ATP-binding protein